MTDWTARLLSHSCKWNMFRRMSTNVEEINRSLRAVIERVQNAAGSRPKSLPQISPRLVAVTKTKPVADIQAAYSLGQRHFGENYVQELEEKSKNPEILEHCKDIKWHFIGHLQRNKTKTVALTPSLYMVETIDSQKLAQTINNHWEKHERPGKLKVMVQVNTSGEDNKSGCTPDIMVHMVKFVREKCPCLEFSGLMTIGALGYNPENGPNPDFLALVKCREEVCSALNLRLDEVELSMGMSSDFEHAIGLGSTNVRVGSTIFGARNYANKGKVSSPSQPNAESSQSEQPNAEGSQSETMGGASNSQVNQSEAAGSQPESSTEAIVNSVENLDLSKDTKHS